MLKIVNNIGDFNSLVLNFLFFGAYFCIVINVFFQFFNNNKLIP